MFGFARNCCAVVGLGFVLTLVFNPSLTPNTIAVAKIYYTRSVEFVELVVEEWQK